MAGQGSGSGRSRSKSRKHGLHFRTQAPPTTSTAPESTIASTPPGHPLHGQEFIMIPNPRYMELGSQLSLPPQSTPQPTLSPHPPAGGEGHTSPIPGSIPSPTTS